MAELKTKLTDSSVDTFLQTIKDEQVHADCYQIVDMMQKATKAEPKMWGTSIIGFGHTHYKYESGREGDWFLTGFSPRKQNLTLCLGSGYEGYEELLGQLGKHSLGKGYLYIKKLSDVDTKVLKKMIANAVKKKQQA